MSCWGGLKAARVLIRQEKLPRRPGFACPACHAAPPLGELWGCSNCRQRFDTFATGGVCPQCGARFDSTMCIYCFERRPLREWYLGSSPAAPVASPAASEQAS
jgi:hypothetical protein